MRWSLFADLDPGITVPDKQIEQQLPKMAQKKFEKTTKTKTWNGYELVLGVLIL